MNRGSAVDALVVDLLDRVERGGSSVDEILEDLCASNPDEAEDLRASVRALEETGLLAAGVDPPSMPERLGAFRLMARLGSGGMGVVYLAQQDGLARTVALKVLRSEQLWSGGSRLRFQREVEAVARLSHPGIATVHTVGEVDGLPYCALEFVPGASLELWVHALRGRRPEELTGADLRAVVAARMVELELTDVEPWDEAFWSGGLVEVVLRVGRQVAAALDHAHQRGVLHRDVKPSNVVVTPGGRAVLVDFGLASLEGAQRVTRTGAQLGSLPYMAPEQIEGRAAEVGARTDVYGLGVTLYELLTLSLPFGEAESSKVRGRILAGTHPPPTGVNGAIAPDVALVVAKAMAVEPDQRYGSAAALARDLGNLLELRPIEARSPTARLRVRRWTRRRPALATGVVLGALFLVGGPMGWALNLSWAKARIARALDAEQEARGRAERHRDVVLTALGDALTLGNETLLDTPRMQVQRLDSLERALEVYALLEQENPGHPDVLRQGGRLFLARANLRAAHGHLDEAFADFDRAEQCFGKVLETSPGDYGLVSRRGAVRHQRAAAKRRIGFVRDALTGFEAAVSDLRIVVAASEDAGYRNDLAIALASYSVVSETLGHSAQAVAAAEEGLALAEELLALDGDDPGRLWTDAHLREILATALGRGPRCEDLLQGALAAYQRALAVDPGSRADREALANVHGKLAGRLKERGQVAAARAELERSLALRRELHSEYPAVLEYRDDLLATRTSQAVLLDQLGEVARAREQFVEIADEWCALAEDAPERGDLAWHAATALINFAGSIATHGGDAVAGFAALDEAETYHGTSERLGTDHPGQAETSWLLAYNRGLLATHSLDPAEALTLVEEFECHGERQDPIHLRYAADLWNELALAWRAAEQVQEEQRAVGRLFALLGRAVEAGYREVGELSTTQALAPYRSRPEYAALLEAVSGQ